MIYWMPHAQAEKDEDADLTTLGYNQAYKAGLWLKDRHITHIISGTDDHTHKTAAIIDKVLMVGVQTETRLDVMAESASRAILSDLTRILGNLTDNTLIVTRHESMVEIVPRLCVNAAALQRVTTPHPTGIVVLERYNAGRFICHAWDLREHLR